MVVHIIRYEFFTESFIDRDGSSLGAALAAHGVQTVLLDARSKNLYIIALRQARDRWKARLGICNGG